MKNKLLKKSMAILMTLAMVIGLLPTMTITASAVTIHPVALTNAATVGTRCHITAEEIFGSAMANSTAYIDIGFTRPVLSTNSSTYGEISFSETGPYIGEPASSAFYGEFNGFMLSTSKDYYFIAPTIAGEYKFTVLLWNEENDNRDDYEVSITVDGTANAAPTVSTDAITTYTTTTATMGGNVTADGGASVTERGVVYSTSDQTPTIAEGATKDANGSGTGAFSESITGLTAGTKYYVRAYAINSVNTSYGSMVEFTTTAAGNTSPNFIGASTLTVAANAPAMDIKSLLHVSDADSGQTLTWSQNTAPSHGSLSFLVATASSGGNDITPSGTITYTPTAGYSGDDEFTVQVNDGTATSTHAITVTVNSTTGVVTEHFADEATTASAFTNTGFSFNLQGGRFDIANIDNYGWTGTTGDSFYVDNEGHLLTSAGIVGSIQIASGTFKAHSIYVFPGENNLQVKNTGTVIIRGKLGSDTKFTRTVASNEINLSSNPDNGYTFVDLSAYNTTAIDTLEFELTGALRYLAIDAFKHESTAVNTNAAPTLTTISKLTGANEDTAYEDYI